MNQFFGVDVYYINKKDVRNTVFFPDGKYKYYETGGLLFEQISDEAIDLMTEKVLNMIRFFPEYDKPFSHEMLDKAFDWLFCAINDEDLPVATALFRSSFFVEVISHTDEVGDSCQSIGEFLETYYEEYSSQVTSFAIFFDALAADASGRADDFQTEIANAFKERAEELYKEYTRKCSVRRNDGTVTVTTYRILNIIQLLVFEYCWLKKENKSIRICENCGRYFIPHRNNAIYCKKPSPQDVSRLCSEIGSQIKRKEKIVRDPFEHQHHNTMSKLHMAIKRVRDKSELYLLDGHIRKLNDEKERYAAARMDSDEKGDT